MNDYQNIFNWNKKTYDNYKHLYKSKKPSCLIYNNLSIKNDDMNDNKENENTLNLDNKINTCLNNYLNNNINVKCKKIEKQDLYYHKKSINRTSIKSRCYDCLLNIKNKNIPYNYNFNSDQKFKYNKINKYINNDTLNKTNKYYPYITDIDKIHYFISNKNNNITDSKKEFKNSTIDIPNEHNYKDIFIKKNDSSIGKRKVHLSSININLDINENSSKKEESCLDNKKKDLINKKFVYKKVIKNVSKNKNNNQDYLKRKDRKNSKDLNLYDNDNDSNYKSQSYRNRTIKNNNNEETINEKELPKKNVYRKSKINNLNTKYCPINTNSNININIKYSPYIISNKIPYTKVNIYQFGKKNSENIKNNLFNVKIKNNKIYPNSSLVSTTNIYNNTKVISGLSDIDLNNNDYNSIINYNSQNEAKNSSFKKNEANTENENKKKLIYENRLKYIKIQRHLKSDLCNFNSFVKENKRNACNEIEKIRQGNFSISKVNEDKHKHKQIYCVSLEAKKEEGKKLRNRSNILRNQLAEIIQGKTIKKEIYNRNKIKNEINIETFEDCNIILKSSKNNEESIDESLLEQINQLKDELKEPKNQLQRYRFFE